MPLGNVVKILLVVTLTTLANCSNARTTVQVYPPTAHLWDEDRDGIIGTAGKDYPNYSRIPHTK